MKNDMHQQNKTGFKTTGKKKSFWTKMMSVCSLLLIFSMTSCDDFLETHPNDAIYLNEYFKSSYDIDDAARGMYDGLQGCVEKMFIWGEVRGDLVWAGPGAGWELKELNEMNVSSSNKLTDWSEFYDVINRANLIIKYAHKVTESDFNFTKTEEMQFVAEAINVRSLCYFWLVRTFGDVPLVLEPYDDNYLNTKNDTIWNQNDGSYTVRTLPVYTIDPTDADIVLDTLEAQLKRVEGINRTYPQEFSNTTTRNPAVYTTRFKSIANLALQADIKLWRNKYAESLALTERIFNYDKATYSLGTYLVAPVCYNSSPSAVQRWINIFMKDGCLSPESIFELAFQTTTPDLNILQRYTSARPEEGGEYLVRPSDKAIEYWQTDVYYGKSYGDTCDVMRGFNASFTGTYNRATQQWENPEIFKFIVNGTNGLRRNGYESDANWTIYRMADVMCMKSEAMNRLGYYNNAIQYLQGSPYFSKWYTLTPITEGPIGLRKRACVIEYIGPNDAAPDKFDAEEIILEERAKELAFEGRRWFDLLRIAKRGDVLSLFLDEMEYAAPEGKKQIIRQRASNPENWFLPYNDNAKKFFVNPNYRNKSIDKIKTTLGL